MTYLVKYFKIVLASDMLHKVIRNLKKLTWIL